MRIMHLLDQKRLSGNQAKGETQALSHCQAICSNANMFIVNIMPQPGVEGQYTLLSSFATLHRMSSTRLCNFKTSSTMPAVVQRSSDQTLKKSNPIEPVIIGHTRTTSHVFLTFARRRKISLTPNTFGPRFRRTIPWTREISGIHDSCFDQKRGTVMIFVPRSEPSTGPNCTVLWKIRRSWLFALQSNASENWIRRRWSRLSGCCRCRSPKNTGT